MSNQLQSIEKDVDYDATKKQTAFDKVSRIPVKVVQREPLKKPSWIRVKPHQPTRNLIILKRFCAKITW